MAARSVRERKLDTSPHSYISHSKLPRPPSATALARCYGVRNTAYFDLEWSSESYSHADYGIEEDNKCTLKAVGSKVGLSPACDKLFQGDEESEEGPGQLEEVKEDKIDQIKATRRSEGYAKEVLLWHLSDTQDDQYEIDKAILKVNELPTLLSNTLERPDIVLYSHNHKKLITTFEVLSSPIMEFTIYKSIIGVANVIRLLKCRNKSFNYFTCFTLPSIQSAGVIVKVSVEWKDLKFWVSLTCYEDIEEGLKAINDIYIQQTSNLPDLPTDVSETLIEIEASDLAFLKLPSCKPIPSVRHVMF
ncbi:PREDICTED: uncharacterized protein LOC109582718 [Amphimedon queenslandica]|uniref:Uncharacterized protein n=1 Tax=Amphimedon queenslandica TaxID=400682 RepID=A0AAN0J824_AMPQE|nr:PREDICTED: uncharacterized protein LOC109582718 [Amphimedon queenslandica]XP_019853169.1 PREDICTED: uncharacterized protein LOC109582718 [Amphimedon queenslandica]|eukprot:XP_019853168.1 PREDICTED: uncharacterized protein LOC109582718 [Amphimedon queenslandica]